MLDGDDSSSKAENGSEKDQLRKMLAQGDREDDSDGDTRQGRDGLTEVTDSSEEQSLPRGQDAGAVSKDEARRIPGEQQAEAVPEDQSPGAGATPEAVSRRKGQERQASIGQQNEAMATPGAPQDDDDGSTKGQDGTDEHEAQAESSDASAERLSELSSPGEDDTSQQTESPRERYRKLKEDARQEFIKQEREDNEATVEKETDSLKEKYDQLGDDHIVH